MKRGQQRALGRIYELVALEGERRPGTLRALPVLEVEILELLELLEQPRHVAVSEWTLLASSTARRTALAACTHRAAAILIATDEREPILV